MPLRNTRVIHPRFQQHHQTTAHGQMTAECTITRPSLTPTGFNQATGKSTYPDPVTVYPVGEADGICRIQRRQVGAGPIRRLGDRDVVTVEYSIALPVDVDLIKIGDLWTGTACPDDPDLVGLKLYIHEVSRGSIRWQTNLIGQLQPPPSDRR